MRSDNARRRERSGGDASKGARASALPYTFALAALAAHASAAPRGCVFTTPAGDFDLAPLGAVRIVSREAASFGWTYLFSACANVDASTAAGHCSGMSPAVQATSGACYSLGSLAQRSVAPLAADGNGRFGVTVALEGGDSCGGGVTRTISIGVVCADVARASKVRVLESTTRTCVYNAAVESRAGCPLACARDPATGAVCGGMRRGACLATASGAAACVCLSGHAGPLCADEIAEPAQSSLLAPSGTMLVGVVAGMALAGTLAAIAAKRCCQTSAASVSGADSGPAFRVPRLLSTALLLAAAAGTIGLQTCLDGANTDCLGRSPTLQRRSEVPQQPALPLLPLCRDRPLLGPLVAHDEGLFEDGPWPWRPTTCRFRHFEPPSARECLRNRHLFFVGNSIAREVYGHSLAYVCEHGMRNRSAEKQTCKTHNGCSERCEAALDSEFGITFSHFFVNRMSDVPPPGYRYHDPDLCGGAPSSCLAAALEDSRPGDVLVFFSGVALAWEAKRITSKDAGNEAAMALWPKGPALGALEPHELLLFDSIVESSTRSFSDMVAKAWRGRARDIFRVRNAPFCPELYRHGLPADFLENTSALLPRVNTVQDAVFPKEWGVVDQAGINQGACEHYKDFIHFLDVPITTALDIVLSGLCDAAEGAGEGRE